MATYKRKQGDSLWINVTCSNTDSIDATWANWSGVWDIASTIGGTPLITGALTRSTSTGTFYLRIGPATTAGWTALATGTYYLTIQIDNTSVDYRHEEQHKLIVQTQGYTP